MKISDSFGRTDSATSHQNFNRFFLWFALEMMTESMSEFLTPTVPVLQEVVNQEMAIISHYTAARCQSSAIFNQNLLIGLGRTLLFDMTSFRATTPSCKKKKVFSLCIRPEWKLWKFPGKEEGKRHSHWLDQRSGAFPCHTGRAWQVSLSHPRPTELLHLKNALTDNFSSSSTFYYCWDCIWEMPKDMKLTMYLLSWCAYFIYFRVKHPKYRSHPAYHALYLCNYWQMVRCILFWIPVSLLM